MGEQWNMTTWIQNIEGVSECIARALILDMGDAPSFDAPHA